MFPEVNFYQYDEELVKSLAPLLIKILDEERNALIFCRDEKKISEIDNSLWIYGRNKFIPHITIFDQGFDLERQPILLSNKQENANNSQYLILLEEVEIDYAKNFSRIFYFFEERNFLAIKNYATKIQDFGAKINFYKKSEGKWMKANF